MTTGVYTISSSSGRVYVGSSFNIEKRWIRHLWQLNRGDHHNIPLQRAFEKYGEDGLTFAVLEICKVNELLVCEQAAILKLKPAYNVSQEAGSPMSGVKHSNESKALMSLSHIERNRLYGSPIAGRVKGPLSEDVKLKIRYAQCDRIQCVETGQIFESSTEAGQWCIEQGLTKVKMQK